MKHAKYDTDEVVERYRAEFTTGIADLEAVEWKIRDLLDVVEGLLTHQPAAA